MFRRPKINNILFATDLSQNAEIAFSYAVEMAVAQRAKVSILNIIEKIAPNAELLLTALLGYSSTDEYRRNNEIDLIAKIKLYIERFCDGVIKEIPECPFILGDIVVERGRAVERILHHAGTGNYDVLVIGSRGLGLVKETIMGGTSRKVILHSPIPVLIVPVQQSDPGNHH